MSNWLHDLIEESYRRYQFDWLVSHGYTIGDIISYAGKFAFETMAENNDYSFDEESFKRKALENGFGGECFVCHDEFLFNEFEDAQYMYSLLSDEDSEIYELYKARKWAGMKIQELGKDAVDNFYGFSIPNHLLKPGHYWSFSREKTLNDVLFEIRQRLGRAIDERSEK